MEVLEGLLAEQGSEYLEQGLEDSEVCLEFSEVCLEISEGVPTTVVSRQRVTSWIRAATVAGKRCCPIPVNRGIVAGEPVVS